MLQKVEKNDVEENQEEVFMRYFLKSARAKTLYHNSIDDTIDQRQNKVKVKVAEVQLTLMKLDRVCITKLACSNTHSLAVSLHSVFYSIRLFMTSFILVHEYGRCILMG